MKRYPLVILLLAALCGCAGVGEVRTLGRYDFSYRIEGEVRAAPLQIFDDGKQTFFQFREPVPAIFAVDRSKQLVMVPARRDGHYVVVDRIDREFAFLMDQDKARASGRYIGRQNRAVLPHELAPLRESEPKPATAPSTSTSYRIPFVAGAARLDEAAQRALEELLPEALVAKRVVVFATPARKRGDRGLGSVRAAAVRDWLVAHGVSRSLIVVIKAESSTPASEHCDVHVSPAEPDKKPSPVVTHSGQQAQAVLYGAAQPVSVSHPAQPAFVDRGRFGVVQTSMIVR